MLKNSLLLVGGLAFALISGELMVRVFYEPPDKELPGFELSSSPYYQLDEELGWTPKANVRGTHVRHRGMTSEFSTNSLGLRDREHSLGKPEGKRRIVVIGDSFAWGYGVDDGEVFTDVLEDTLPDTEVINLGVTAFGLSQEIRYLKRLGLRFQPDIVVLALCQNDIFRTEPPGDPASGRAAGPDSEVIENEASVSDRGGLFLRLKSALREHSASYGLLIDSVNANRALVKLLVRLGIKSSLSGFDDMDPNVMPALKDYPPELSKSWEATKEELRELKALVVDRGVRLIIALVPAIQSVDERYLKGSLSYLEFDLSQFDVDKPYRALVEFAEGEGIEIVNPLMAFREATKAGEGLYLKWDMHFNPRGHALFAREIAGIVERH